MIVILVAVTFASHGAFAQDNGLPTAQQQRVAEQTINESALRGHIRFLADDLLEGRLPGSRGDELAQRYLAAQFEANGLKPAAPGGGWFQRVPLVGVTTLAPPTMTLIHGEQELQLRRHDDYVVSNGKPTESAGFQNAELVFVGYGIVAPEYVWDDYKGADLRGKVLLMMNNDPSDDPKLFAGQRRLYYGRWDYKYEMAARQGAVGAIIIHTTPSAGYPYQVVQTSWTGEEFQLRGGTGPRLEMQGWFTEDASRRAVALGGHDLDQLRKAAESRDFQPVPLGLRMSIALTCTVREKDTANVLGLLPGRDEELGKEMVVYMAHHDHIGMAVARDQRGDNICNGAVDNASGVAALLAIAEAYGRLPEPPARSILFASVGAEEQGLLGSAYLAEHPPVPAGFLAAVLNIDGVNILGPTHDVNVIGYGKSTMDQIVQRIASWQNRVVTPDQFPDRGYYYRSDQFSLAKIGVPGVYLHSGIHVMGKPEGWGREQLEKWIETNYHQPSDEYSDTWDLGGAVSDVRLLFYTGLQAAMQRELPQWTAGDEFEPARHAALESRSRL
jgi:Zn-dependent M28 family amino/carboxypeptidase